MLHVPVAKPGHTETYAHGPKPPAPLSVSQYCATQSLEAAPVTPLHETVKVVGDDVAASGVADMLAAADAWGSNATAHATHTRAIAPRVSLSLPR